MKVLPTYWCRIYVAGDIGIIKQVCRKYCMEIGLCVTVHEVDFIYTGGEESGVEIGLVNYPRFPDKENNIKDKAIMLAKLIVEEAYQKTALVVTPTETIWLDERPL